MKTPQPNPDPDWEQLAARLERALTPTIQRAVEDGIVSTLLPRIRTLNANLERLQDGRFDGR